MYPKLDEKNCSKCKKLKPISLFNLYKTGKRAGKMKMPRKRKPLTNSRARWKRIKETYGLSQEDYEAIFQEQGGVCYICQRSPYEIRPRRWLAVDHCHQTGRIRGLLCYSCNHRLLGYLIKDDKQIAKRLVKYLTRRTNYGKVSE